MRKGWILSSLVIFATSAVAGGCTTWVTSKPAGGGTGEQSGLRYYLPIPVLVVTPQPDGTITVETDYIPDRRHEYVIEAGSFLSTHKLEVQTDNKGLLMSVTINQSSAAVAEELAKQSGTVAKSALDTIKAERTAEETKKKTAADDIQKNSERSRSINRETPNLSEEARRCRYSRRKGKMASQDRRRRSQPSGAYEQA